MMKSSRFEKIKNRSKRNQRCKKSFQTKKEIDDTTIRDIRNFFRMKKKIKQSKIQSLEMLGTFLSMKKKIIINQEEQVIFGATIILNMKVTVIEIKHCQLRNILIKLHHTPKIS